MRGKGLIKGLGMMFALMIFLFTIAFMLRGTLEKEERHECFQWQSWVKEIRDFKPNSAMKDQCNYWGIKINS